PTADAAQADFGVARSARVVRQTGYLQLAAFVGRGVFERRSAEPAGHGKTAPFEHPDRGKHAGPGRGGSVAAAVGNSHSSWRKYAGAQGPRRPVALVENGRLPFGLRHDA